MPKYRSVRHRKKYFELTQRIPDALDLYEHLPFQIGVVSNLLQLNRDPEIREIIDLEPRDLRVILNIGSYMPIKSADIAYQSRLDSYTVTRAVKQLESLGLIEQESNESNKKAKFFILSDKGLAIYRNICQAIKRREECIENNLSQNEKKQLMSLLAKLEDKTESMLACAIQTKLDHNKMITSEQKEIIRWNKKSTG